MTDDLQRQCLAFDRVRYERALRRLKTAPLELDADDFRQLGIVSGRLEGLARTARYDALAAKASTP